MDALQQFNKQQVAGTDRPRLRAGDIISVEMKITEGEKERLQTFEGTVLGVRGSGPSVTFTVRREVGRFAVERIFPLYSPLITNIEVAKRQKVRRSKLGYLREAGRRRVKEDVLSMQRLVKEEDEKKRLAEVARKKAQEAKDAAEKAKAKEEADAKKAAEEKDEKQEEGDAKAEPKSEETTEKE